MHSYRPAPVLEALGVCSEDEQLYRALLARPEATVTDLAEDTGWPAARVTRHLRSLLTLGLACRTPGRPALYTPAVPEAAVELLALRKQAAIVEARLGATVLTAEFRAGNEAGPFTVVRGAQAIAQRYDQAQQSAQSEVLVLDRPPYAVLPVAPRRTSGVSYRMIYDMAALGDPAELAAARSAGTSCRMLRDVPLKLVVADRRTGLLQTGADVLVELRPSTLLDGLLRLFELLWQQATPLAFEPSGGPLSVDDQQLLGLAAAGLTDQAIARRLGVAQRTVERRMQRILKALDATTRFQAGLRAGQRGLLSP
ncbi:transcriptional regulator, TrmB [Kribbella flavida DSM 17836]|uniref:Transcriptional regulator, TrmB n=1 Tax=Kribbella flavida (strain DSM 17836 / JCM 10339 / NBRC 14399) TaxID=479435 RepID=D2PW14_KRIFD|nr:helix-turn-helix domain-containing protein [Kribbella flavida]ADB29671.1 transcriptional regulator, TrmB [Kribbella flavida DSM 17836]